VSIPHTLLFTSVGTAVHPAVQAIKRVEEIKEKRQAQFIKNRFVNIVGYHGNKPYPR